MTTGPEWRVILAFALPIMGTNLLQTLFTLADSLIVGNFIGPAALGATGLTGSTTWFLLTICQGIGAGASIVVAQYYGANREKDVEESVGAAYTLSLAVGLLLMVACLALTRPLIRNFLRAPEEMVAMSEAYFRIIATGMLFLMLYNVTNGLLRSHGDSKGGFYFLLIAALMNVSLDLLFVVRFGWGVAGAAAATVFSQACCALASMIYLVRRFPRLSPRLGFKTDELRKMRAIARISWPIIVQYAIYSIGFTIMQRLVNSFGVHSIEGYVAMGRIENLAHIPSNSFNAAISAFAGQNIGAGKPERAMAGYRASLKMGAVITIVAAISVILFARPMLGLFNIAGESMRRGWEHLILLMCFIVLSMITNVTSGFLQGTGDVRIPTVSGLANLTIRLGIAYLLANTFIDFRSVYIGIPFAAIAGCLIVVLRYRSGRWRKKALVGSD